MRNEPDRPDTSDMAPKLTEGERDDIRALIEQGLSANEVSRRSGRAVSTVSAIAREIGWTFAQTNTAKAREARSAYSAEVRAEAAAIAQERMLEAMDKLHERQQVVVMSKEGAEVLTVDLDARGWRDLATAVHTLQRTVLDISRHDDKGDTIGSAFDAWLEEMRGGS